MMDNAPVSICRAVNGYVVRFSDPEIMAANKKSDKYMLSEIEMVFPDAAAVLKFLGKNLEKLVQEDEYDSAFAKALKE